MQDGNSDPTVARGLYRVLVLFMSIALGSYFRWEMFSTAAALSRLQRQLETFLTSNAVMPKVIRRLRGNPTA